MSIEIKIIRDGKANSFLLINQVNEETICEATKKLRDHLLKYKEPTLPKCYCPNCRAEVEWLSTKCDNCGIPLDWLTQKGRS